MKKTFAFLMLNSFGIRRESMTCKKCHLGRYIESGNYNGYVAVHKDYADNMIINREQHDFIDIINDVHGGCTYCRPYKANFVMPLDEIPVNANDYIVFGFDTCHCGDTEDNWTLEATKDETILWQTKIEQYIEEELL